MTLTYGGASFRPRGTDIEADSLSLRAEADWASDGGARLRAHAGYGLRDLSESDTRARFAGGLSVGQTMDWRGLGELSASFSGSFVTERRGSRTPLPARPRSVLTST